MKCMAFPLFAFLPLTAWAQTTQDIQVWTSVAGTAALNEESTGPSAWLDVHLRRSGANTVHIFRPGLGWRLGDAVSVWAGYGWIPTLPDEGDLQIENRFWQQVIAKHSASRLGFMSRTRFEQRLADSGDDLGLRVRQFGRVGWDWRDDGRCGLVVWDELFLGLNETDWGAPAGLDQNRLFAGVFLKSGTRVRGELGYLSLFVDRDGGNTLGHVLSTTVFVSL